MSPDKNKDQQNEQGMPKVPPKLERKIQAYQATISKVLHGKKTSGDIFRMLKSADPEVSIPQTALTVNEQIETKIKERGSEPSLDVKLAGGVFLVGELIEIGNAGGLWEMSIEDGMATFLEPTIQQYIQKGLKDGSIDPIELQQKVEPLMNEEEKGLGMQGAEAAGLPAEPGENAAMEQYANMKVNKVKRKAPQGSALDSANQGGM